MKLYEITVGMHHVDDLFEQDEIDEQAKHDALEFLQTELKAKSQNIIGLYQDLKGESAKFKAEEERLALVRKAIDRKIERLEKFTTFALEQMGVDEVKTEIGKINFRKSQSVEITDQELLSDEYVKVTIVKQADKTAIKDAIKSGKEVKGAILKDNKNLQIK